MMKRVALLAGILAMSATFALAQTSTWVSDQAHSEVTFTVKHLSISNVHGRFGKVDAKIDLDPADITKSSVVATIDVSTVDTGVEARDKDLRSANFFEVDKYPTAKFTSTAVSKNSDGLTVVGNLELHGMTVPVTLMVEGPTGPIKAMGGKEHSGFSATTTLSRAAFGIAPKMPNGMVGDEIKLNIDLDVVKQ
jgi:polyisoprenoid-binding protein YceI